MGERVRVEHEEGGLSWLRFGDGRANVLDEATMTALREALSALREPSDRRLLVLRGEGGRFSSGASVEEHLPGRAGGMLRAFGALLREVALHPLPVAVLVERWALGGAFELALAADLCFAVEGATLGCPEVRLGVFPPALLTLGPVRLPGAVVSRALLTGETLPARRWADWGLCAELLPAEGDPAEALRRWYREQLAPLSGWAVREAKAAWVASSGVAQAAGERLEAMERRYLQRVAEHPEAVEGLTAFLQKRSPNWRHGR